MASAQFTTSPPIRSSIKRKYSSSVITVEDAKRLRLELEEACTDTTIAECQQSTGQDTTITLIPVDDIWGRPQDEIKTVEEDAERPEDLREEVEFPQDLREQAENIDPLTRETPTVETQMRVMIYESEELANIREQRLRALGDLANERAERRSGHKERLKTVGESVKHDILPLMRIYQANTLLGMAKRIFGNNISVERLQELAGEASDEQLRHIPTKYWKAVRCLPDIQCGSETTLEFDFEAKHFATLLGFEGYETKHNFWKEAFPLLYGGSVEEVAARSSYSI